MGMGSAFRVLAAIPTLVWIGVWGGFTFLVWAEDRFMELETRGFNARFDVVAPDQSQVIATIIAAILIGLGAAILWLQARASWPAPISAGSDIATRVEDMQRQLNELRELVISTQAKAETGKPQAGEAPTQKRPSGFWPFRLGRGA